LHLNWYEGHTGYLPGNWDGLWSLSIEETTQWLQSFARLSYEIYLTHMFVVVARCGFSARSALHPGSAFWLIPCFTDADSSGK
jgi:hypothetical protein